MSKEINSIFFLNLFTLSSSKEFLKQQKETFRFLLEDKERQRSSGILMHITSLSSKYWKETMGSEAYRFADFLVKAKQKNWQMLSLGPTSYAIPLIIQLLHLLVALT